MSVLFRLFGRRETRSEPMNPQPLYNLIDGGSPFAGTGMGYGAGYGDGHSPGAPGTSRR